LIKLLEINKGKFEYQSVFLV
jgi:hypothetical protein